MNVLQLARFERGDIVNPQPFKIYKNINGPSTIAFTITNRCNLRCLHCFNNSGEGLYDELKDAQLIDIANQIAELKPIVVCLCGGEPIVRGKVVYDIIKILKKSCGMVNIVSNGYKVNENVLLKLKEAGIDLIQFSVDGYSAIQHDNFRARSGAFENVLNAIKKSKEIGLKVAVSCVPNKLNINNIEDVVKLCSALGVDSFRMMPFIPMGRGSSTEDLLISPTEYIVMQQKLEHFKTKKSMHVEWGDPIDHLYRMPKNGVLGYNTYSIEIRFDGKITPSSYLPLVVGNLTEKKLKDYWNNGLSTVWTNKEVIKYASKIKNIYDFDNFYKKPFSGNGDIEVKL